MNNIIDPLAKVMGQWAVGISLGSIFLRLTLSFLLSAILGCERASKRHSAGLRTFIVVSLASTTVGMLDIFLIESYGIKFSFVSCASIVALALLSNSSIIFSSKSQIKGLTTSVSLWTCGIIALCLGLGFYTVSLIVFFVLLCCLSLLPVVEIYLKNRSNYFEIHLELENKNNLPRFMTTIRELGLKIDEIELNSAYLNTGLSVYTIALSIVSPELKKYKTHKEIISAINSLDYVNFIEEM